MHYLDTTERRIHNQQQHFMGHKRRRSECCPSEGQQQAWCHSHVHHNHSSSSSSVSKLTTLCLLLSLWRSAESFGVVVSSNNKVFQQVHAHPHVVGPASFCYQQHAAAAADNKSSFRSTQVRLPSTCLEAVALGEAPPTTSRRERASPMAPDAVLEQHRVANAPKLGFLEKLLHVNDHHHHHHAKEVAMKSSTAASLSSSTARSMSTTATATAAAPSLPRPSTNSKAPPVLTPAAKNAEAWARKYTTVEALRQSFGGSKNGVWGDLDAASARKLYKALLPTALLDLHDYYSHQLMVQQQQDADAAADYLAADLAPLAYQARKAAKLYARERCTLPARVAANLYDGFRQWRRYGQFNMHGMSYQQVWDKYAKLLLQQQQEQDLDESAAAAKIGLKILERACSTNPVVDQLVLKNQNDDSKKHHHHHHLGDGTILNSADLQKITTQLEEDVHELLTWHYEDDDKDGEDHVEPHLIRSALMTPQRYRKLRNYARIKRKLARPFVSADEESHDHTTTTKTLRVKKMNNKAATTPKATASTSTPKRRRRWNDRQRQARQESLPKRSRP